ncbi:MAG: rRNA pseudouridine synthase [Spirochaetales bacterium]|nr:rRNA pseudouridine synthase [Spirochaetales bacterium]
MSETVKSDFTAEPMRLQKYMAACGVASRRQSEQLIIDGHVSVNGHIVTELGTKVTVNDEVNVDGVRCEYEPKVYFVLNKPRGYICTVSDGYGRKTIYELIDCKLKLFSVGRLDYDSEGLIIVTNDGEFANELMHPRYGLTKQYLVVSEQNVPDKMITAFKKGISIGGVFYKASDIYRAEQSNELLITLGEGKKREIRNVYKHFGIKIKTLRRVKIGKMCLDKLDLNVGEYKQILLENLKKMIF